MNRRGYLGLMAVGAVGGCTGTEDVRDSVNKKRYSHLQEVEWVDDQRVLSVTFPEEHDADYVVLVHEYDGETVIWYSEAPRFNGPIRIPMLKAVACDRAEYPTPVFEVVASNGRPFVDLMEQILDRREIEVDQEWLNRASNVELEPFECQRM